MGITSGVYTAIGVNTDYCCGCCVGAAVTSLLLNSCCAPSDKKGLTDTESVKATPLIAENPADDGLEDKCETITAPEKQSNFLIEKIKIYQREISPKLKQQLGVERLCRYTPSCSEYAKQSIERYGNIKGSAMAAGRLLRCNPFSKGGSDPVR